MKLIISTINVILLIICFVLIFFLSVSAFMIDQNNMLTIIELIF